MPGPAIQDPAGTHRRAAPTEVALTLRQLRLRVVWLLVVPFLLFASPTRDALIGGAVLALVGLAIRAWSAGTIHKDQSLTTSGPYAFSRNPLYLGSFLLGLGVTVAGGHWIWPVLFLAFFALVYGRTMSEEARLLGELFPDRYPEYRAAVPAFLPRLTPWRADGAKADGDGETAPAPAAFEWSRYRAYREWEALLGTVAAFALLAARLWWSTPG